MFSSNRIFHFAVAVSVAAAAAFSTCATAIIDCATAAYGWCRIAVGKLLAGPVDMRQVETLQRQDIATVQARQFLARILKRDRIRFTSAWRLCPSI